jgi:hypothetical protein
MPDTNAPRGEGGGRAALRHVRLVRRDDDVLVAPAERPGGEAGLPPEQHFDPFRLAKLPKSITDQLCLFGDLVHRRYGRCVGVLLLLDPGTHEWTYRVPAQRCGKTASCWSASIHDVPQVGHDHLLAGSFQTRVLAAGEDAADAPPPCDGVHFVLRLDPGGGSVLSFLRAEGRTQAVPADVVVFDDLEAALQECLSRLSFR